MNRTLAFSAAGVAALLIAGALLLRSTAPEATPPSVRPAPMAASCITCHPIRARRAT